MNQFFACKIVVLGLLKLNINSRHYIPEFLTVNLLLSWKAFFSHNFCPLLVEQLIDLEKLRTENLKFRTDLQDQEMDGWSVTQKMIVYEGRLLKKS